MEVGKKAGQGQYGRAGKEARQEQILEVIGLDDILMQISPCKRLFSFSSNCQVTSVQRTNSFLARGSSWESMATNVEEKIDANADTEGMCTAPAKDGQNDPLHTGNGQNGTFRGTRLLNLGRLLLHLVCLGYSFYLIWLWRTSRTVITTGSLASSQSSSMLCHFCCCACSIV